MNVDESFVLPALTRFSGVPTVVEDDAGQTRIVYTFPELAATAVDAPYGRYGSDRDSAMVLSEEAVPFSAAAPEQLIGAGLLGAANLAGVLYLGRLLNVIQKAGGAAALAGSSVGLYGVATGLLPLLGAYAVLFVAAPVLRNFSRNKANASREERNTLRRAWASALTSRSPPLVRKLRAAAAVAPKVRRIASAAAAAAGVVGGRGTAEVARAPVEADDALESFDERLARRERQRTRDVK